MGFVYVIYEILQRSHYINMLHYLVIKK